MSVPDLYQTLFERAPEAILVLSREGQVMTANAEALKLLCADPDQVVGKPVLALVVPEDRDRVKQLFLRVLGGREREWTSRFRRGDGVTRVQWVRAVPDGTGGVAQQIVMFTRDITEHRSGRPETLQLQTLLENLPEQLVAVVDPQGRIRYSSGLARTHYRDDVESLGSRYAALLDGEEDHRLLASLLDEIRQGRDWAGTHWHRRVDGSVFPMRTYASAYLDPRSGRVLGGLLVARDTSVEVDARERCRRADHMAGVGEIMPGIATRLQEITRRVGSALAASGGAGASCCAGATRELTDLDALASALSGFASPGEPRRARLCLADAVRAVAAGLAARMADLGVRLDVRTGGEGTHAYVDPDMARRSVSALVEVAARRASRCAPPDVGILVVAAPGGVRVRVTDPGAPEDPADLERYFEPFVIRDDGHAGLAMAHVRAMVRAHGGTVAAMPRDGRRGTEVTLFFPLEAPDATLRFRPTPLSLSRSRSVLVVDDEATVRKAIRHFLEKVGFEVREAWSGRSALAQITVSSPPELVLTDLKMADGSGDWFLDQLSRDFPDLLRRTVILTGDTEEAAQSGATRKVGCPVLLKPVELSHLLEALDEVAAR